MNYILHQQDRSHIRIQSKKNCLRRNLFHKFCLRRNFFIKFFASGAFCFIKHLCYMPDFYETKCFCDFVTAEKAHSCSVRDSPTQWAWSRSLCASTKLASSVFPERQHSSSKAAPADACKLISLAEWSDPVAGTGDHPRRSCLQWFRTETAGGACTP